MKRRSSVWTMTLSMTLVPIIIIIIRIWEYFLILTCFLWNTRMRGAIYWILIGKMPRLSHPWFHRDWHEVTDHFLLINRWYNRSGTEANRYRKNNADKICLINLFEWIIIYLTKEDNYTIFLLFLIFLFKKIIILIIYNELLYWMFRLERHIFQLTLKNILYWENFIIFFQEMES